MKSFFNSCKYKRKIVVILIGYMKLRFIIGGIFAVALLFSCSEEVRMNRKKSKVELQPSLIRLSHYFSEFEEELSFPVWFDDSLVRKANIHKIVRKTYSLNDDTTELRLPRTIKAYTFDESGGLICYNVSQYYEGQEVSSLQFDYPNGIDQFGYSELRTKVPSSVLDQSKYKIYKPEKYASDFLVYKNISDGSYLLCMTNEKYYGPLSVDSILNPTSFDLVMLGGPRLPEKRYRVENRVNESDVISVEYHKKYHLPTELKFEKTPFTYHRNVKYDQNGICNGFTDSTFSIDQMLTVKRSVWSLNEMGNPIKMIHKTDASNNELQNTQIETFEYEYYH